MSGLALAHHGVGVSRLHDQPDRARRHAGLAAHMLGKKHLIALIGRDAGGCLTPDDPAAGDASIVAAKAFQFSGKGGRLGLVNAGIAFDPDPCR